MKYLIIVSALILTAVSCQNDTVTTNTFKNSISETLPKANGESGTVLISIDNTLWQGDIEHIINDQFSDTAQGPYIYAENVFDFIHEDPSTINSIRKKHRNFLRIILDTEKSYEQTEVVVKQDFKASNQLYVVFRDSDKERLETFLKNELRTYIALFDLEETERLTKEYNSSGNSGFDKEAQQKFGISISIPNSARFKANKDSIIYALDKSVDETTRDNPNTGAKGGTYWSQKGILIWNTPYKDETSLEPMTILASRDVTLKQNVKGTVVNSYMATEYAPTHVPTFTYFELDGQKAVKVEGLWKHDGNPAASGGGPFVQYSLVHPTRHTVVHVSTHVFAPRYNKREYIRQIRAILLTVQ